MAIKRKRMTQREKQLRAEVKQELQADGVLPPNKPKLNRKKFVEVAKDEWNERGPGYYLWERYLVEAVSYMISQTEGLSSRVSLEAVGAAKVLKLALRLRAFEQKLKAEGRETCKLMEQYEFIKDILDA